MDFELSSEFSRIQAIPHFTIFAKKSESTRLWFQETLGTKSPGQKAPFNQRAAASRRRKSFYYLLFTRTVALCGDPALTLISLGR